MKIAHLTSAHSRYDTRIFLKQCSSLTKIKDYNVFLIVADNLGDEEKNNVNIIDVGKLEGRINRIFKSSKMVYKKALLLDADVYHFHDPELLTAGLKLKRKGKIVIFDSHEDVAKQMLSKPYLNKWLLKIISLSYKLYENYVCKKLDAIVTATPHIRQNFLKINTSSIDINNYPLLNELKSTSKWSHKKKEACYIGVIAEIRGIKEVVKAIPNNAKLNLVGQFESEVLEDEVKQYSVWQNVNQLGFLNRKEVAKVLDRSMAGLVTFHPLPNHIDAQPNKMFEYMSAGLPVIASHFPLWREIIEGNQCGICVDPQNANEIAEAIKYIVNNKKEAEAMGKRGRQAVVQKYNWAVEEEKLFELYEKLGFRI